MSEHVLQPRLAQSDARRLRDKLISEGADVSFEQSAFEQALSSARAFPSTGGRKSSMGEMASLRERCLEVVGEVSVGSPAEFGAAFDLRIGRVLYEHGVEASGELGDPEVWDFLALVLLPDLVARRLRLDEEDSTPSAASLKARLSGGNRRHVLQRLWRRWLVFGPEVVESRVLLEDDYVALLERSLTSGRPELARRVAESIKSSGATAGERRAYTRAFMRRLLVATGFVALDMNDQEHLDAVVRHVREDTVKFLGRALPDDPRDDSREMASGAPTESTAGAKSIARRRTPTSLNAVVRGSSGGR